MKLSLGDILGTAQLIYAALLVSNERFEIALLLQGMGISRYVYAAVVLLCGISLILRRRVRPIVLFALSSPMPAHFIIPIVFSYRVLTNGDEYVLFVLALVAAILVYVSAKYER